MGNPLRPLQGIKNLDRSKKQINKNLIMNITLFIINLCISLWLISFYIDQLGTVEYGFIALATALNQYFGIITITIIGAVSRYLTIHIQRDEQTEALFTINTAFITISLLILILLPFVVLICFNIDSVLTIPQNLEEEISFLLLFSILGFFVSVLSSVFQVTLYSNNRLDLIKLIETVLTVSRTVFIILFFLCVKPSLLFVGFSNFLSALIALSISYYLSIRQIGYIKIKPRYFSLKKLKELLFMGGWSVIHQAGDLLLYNAELIIINKFIGLKEVGIYGIVLAVGNLIKGLIGSASAVMGPLMYKSFSDGNREELIALTLYYVKAFSFILAISLNLFLAFSDIILEWWVGKAFADIGILLFIKVGALLFIMPVGILFTVFRAYLKVKVPAVTAFILGSINVLVAFLLAVVFKWDLAGIALASSFAYLCQTLFSTIYGSKILKIRFSSFINPIIKSTGIFLAGFLLIRFIKSGTSDIYTTGFVVAAVFLIFIPCSIYLIFNKIERDTIIRFLRFR